MLRTHETAKFVHRHIHSSEQYYIIVKSFSLINVHEICKMERQSSISLCYEATMDNIPGTYQPLTNARTYPALITTNNISIKLHEAVMSTREKSE